MCSQRVKLGEKESGLRLRRRLNSVAWSAVEEEVLKGNGMLENWRKQRVGGRRQE